MKKKQVAIKHTGSKKFELFPWSAFLNFQWIPNGTHGRVRPTNLTKYITVYPEQWDGEWEDCPECRIHFKQGKLQDYEHSSKGEWK